MVFCLIKWVKSHWYLKCRSYAGEYRGGRSPGTIKFSSAHLTLFLLIMKHWTITCEGTISDKGTLGSKTSSTGRRYLSKAMFVHVSHSRTRVKKVGVA